MLENVSLIGNVNIKVGAGGTGATTSSTGPLGKDSIITFSGTSYIAKGGGGGGSGGSSTELLILQLVIINQTEMYILLVVVEVMMIIRTLQC